MEPPTSAGPTLADLVEKAADCTLLGLPLPMEDQRELQALWPTLLGLSVQLGSNYMGAAPSTVVLLSRATATSASNSAPPQAVCARRHFPEPAAPPTPGKQQLQHHAALELEEQQRWRLVSDGGGGATCAFLLSADPSAEEEEAMALFSLELCRSLQSACKELLEAAYAELASPACRQGSVSCMRRALSGETEQLAEVVDMALSRARCGLAASSSTRRSRAPAVQQQPPVAAACGGDRGAASAWASAAL